MQTDQQIQSNLFRMMNAVDQKLISTKKKAILLVGMTRAGKSTTFNWISKIPLQGIKQEGRGRNVCYAVYKGDKSTPDAEISSSFVSCTLVPNIYNYSQDCLIIDTAGYEDQRNYIGTIGVSYSLKAIFQVVEEVKFLIVTPQNSIYQNITSLYLAISHFLAMFRLDQISEETKKNIFSSVSMILTKCTNSSQIRSDIQNCLQQLNQPTLNLPKKYLIRDLLSHLLINDRITYFQMAKIGKPPQDPLVIENLNNKNWLFFGIKNATTNDNKSIIELPFNQLFQKLNEQQKKLIKDNLNIRLDSYKQFFQILKSVISHIILPQNINKASDFSAPMFNQNVAFFIKKHDKYNSDSYINQQKFKIYQQSPKKLNAIKLIIELHNAIIGMDLPEFQQIGNIDQEFMKSMAKFRIRFQKISILLVKIYSNRENYSNIPARLQQLIYILLRGIREFQMLFEISPYHVNDASQKINDALQVVFPVNEHIIIQNYIKSFNLNSESILSQLENYFDNKVEAIQFEAYFRQYLQLHQNPIIQTYPLLREIKLILSNYSFKDAQYKQAGKYLLESFEHQCSYQKIKQKNYLTQYPSGSQIPIQISTSHNNNMKNHYLVRNAILNSLKQVLIKLNKFEVAIDIAESNRDIKSVCQIYSILLNRSGLELQKKKNLLEKFAQYCFKKGRWLQSCNLLQELFNIEMISFGKKLQINNKLVEYAQNQQKSKQSYVNYLKQYSIVDAENQKVAQLITKIKDALTG